VFSICLYLILSLFPINPPPAAPGCSSASRPVPGRSSASTSSHLPSPVLGLSSASESGHPPLVVLGPTLSHSSDLLRRLTAPLPQRQETAQPLHLLGARLHHLIIDSLNSITLKQVREYCSSLHGLVISCCSNYTRPCEHVSPYQLYKTKEA
jgi:hypothetical protein